MSALVTTPKTVASHLAATSRKKKKKTKMQGDKFLMSMPVTTNKDTTPSCRRNTSKKTIGQPPYK